MRLGVLAAIIAIALSGCASARARAEDRRGGVKPGMTKFEVRDAAGDPAAVLPASGAEAEVWRYRIGPTKYGDGESSQAHEFDVAFSRDGRVIRIGAVRPAR